jgi:hypothetical protein
VADQQPTRVVVPTDEDKDDIEDDDGCILPSPAAIGSLIFRQNFQGRAP